MYQYRPWHCHLPVQCGLDWRWQDLCAHRQLHAGEQRELPPQRRLRVHRARTGMSKAEQAAGRTNTPSAALSGLGLPEVKTELLSSQACLSTARNTSCSCSITVHLHVRCTGVFRTAARLWDLCSKGSGVHSVIQLDLRQQLLRAPVPRPQHWRACTAVQTVCAGSWAKSNTC